MRIAALDDDPILLELLKAMTESLGHVCHTFDTGAALLKTLRRDSFDLLIVDWHLPDMDGPEVVRAARTLTGPQIPILFVTRRQDEQDIVEALASGADDFMTKPVRIGEFSARINALERRAFPDMSADTLVFGRYQFDAPTRSLHLDGAVLELTELEYGLSLFMFQNCGRLLSREHHRHPRLAPAQQTQAQPRIWLHHHCGVWHRLPARSGGARKNTRMKPQHGYH